MDGRPKLADIGLVTDASDARSFVGTEGYLPPEGPGTPAADIFALGKGLYEAPSGHCAAGREQRSSSGRFEISESPPRFAATRGFRTVPPHGVHDELRVAGWQSRLSW